MEGRAREWLDAGEFFDWVPREPVSGMAKLRVFHAEFGDPKAPLLLLVHGFPTSSVDWYDVVGPLSRDRRVCVLDFPGFGFSDKPKDGSYTLHRDAELVDFYLGEVLGASEGAVVAHDRGDSVALAFAARIAAGETPFQLTNLVVSNGNMFLPLSNLTVFQRLVLDAKTASQVLEVLTPELLAAGLGQETFTPARPPEDPAIKALADTFAVNDGVAVLHDTIQYLVERSENEQGWLDGLAESSVPTALVWGMYDTVSPPRVAAYIWNTYLSTKPGANEFWLLPAANHYLQHDQPKEFVEVVSAALAGDIADAPGPLSDAPGAPLLVDTSRKRMPSAKEVLSGPDAG
jgi:pimeloyl-ACP methyl ester carboxylesterase